MKTMKLTAQERTEIELERNAVYAEIFALDSLQKQQRALRSWFASLERTCTEDNRCIECKLEDDNALLEAASM